MTLVGSRSFWRSCWPVPARQFAINARLDLALIGIDLFAFTRALLPEGEYALAEPTKLHY